MFLPYLTRLYRIQEPVSALAAESTPLEGSSLAESLRAAAEAAVSQTGFAYDENTGLYFDHSTGFYYDSVSISDLFILDGCVLSCVI